MKKEHYFVIGSLIAGSLIGFFAGKYKYESQKTSSIAGRTTYPNKHMGGGVKANITNDDICVSNCVANGWSQAECRDGCGVNQAQII